MSYRLTILAAATLACATAACAADGPTVKFSGFGTLGAVVTNTDEAQYRTSLRQERGATTSPDLGVDSRLGLQADVAFNETFSAVAQALVSRRDGHDGGQIEWLYGQAKVTSWAKVRAGRMVMPAFMLSDSRNVGYATHWIHAPSEVYASYPPSSFDGAQMSLQGQWQDITFTAQPSYGRTDCGLFFALPSKSTLKYGSLSAINLTAERGDWTLRYSLLVGKDAAIVNPLMTVTTGKHDRFMGLGVQYDNGSLLVLSEFTTRRQSSGLFDSDAAYLSAGYRFGEWMPYVSTSRFKSKGPGYVYPAADKTNSVGVRWDVAKNMALKYQLEATTPAFQFTNVSPAFAAANKRVNVHSVALDFVF